MGWVTTDEVNLLREWMQGHPRESMAYGRLNHDDPLRGVVVEYIRTGREEEARRFLARFADALEHRHRCQLLGTLRPPPEVGERRPYDGWILGMERVRGESGVLFYQVDFRAVDGWSGHFDTRTPQDVERIAKMRDRSQLVVVVGEIIKRPYDCLVVFGAQTRLV